MSNSRTDKGDGDVFLMPPKLRRDARGQPDEASLADVIQWFLDIDPRVAILNHPRVEEIFQWKQQASKHENAGIYEFGRAEDRLAIGIFQALALNAEEQALHAWISRLLRALEEASKANEEISTQYSLDKTGNASA